MEDYEIVKHICGITGVLVMGNGWIGKGFCLLCEMAERVVNIDIQEFIDHFL